MTDHSTQAEPPAAAKAPLPEDELRRINADWRAANYPSVGQIYLPDFRRYAVDVPAPAATTSERAVRVSSSTFRSRSC